jgi:hypothetical protein
MPYLSMHPSVLAPQFSIVAVVFACKAALSFL